MRDSKLNNFRKHFTCCIKFKIGHKYEMTYSLEILRLTSNMLINVH